MLNPALVQAMTAEALCESLLRTQHERDQARSEVKELTAQLAEAKKPKPRTRKS